MSVINPSSLQVAKVGYDVPQTGAIAIPFKLQWTSDPVKTLDLSGAQQFQKELRIQSAWVDNTGNNATVTIGCSGAQHNTIVPAGSQGYFPLLVTGSNVFTFTCQGSTASTVVIFMNIPVEARFWFSQDSQIQSVSDVALDACISGNKVAVADATLEALISAGALKTSDTNLATAISAGKVAVADATLEALISAGALKTSDTNLATAISAGKVAVTDAALEAIISGGKLLVSDSLLEAVISGGNLKTVDQNLSTAISGGKLASLEYVTTSGGVTNPWIQANAVVTGTLTASGASAALITGAPGFALSGIQLQLTPNAIQAAAGAFEVTVSDSSFGVIFRAEFYVGTAGVTTLSAGPLVVTPSNFYWNNKTANSTLKINLPAALTAGSLAYVLNFAQTSFVG